MNILWYVMVWSVFFGGSFLALRLEQVKQDRETLRRREEEERIMVRRFRSLKA